MADLPTLAIIDDHELVREGLAALIGDHGHQLARVIYRGANPWDAAALTPDISLLDVDLGVDGPPTHEAVLALTQAGGRVLLISASEDSRSVRAAMLAGSLGFVAKRASVEVLAEAFDAVMKGEIYLTTELASILAAEPDTPGLSPREHEALRLYASGLKISAVANRMGISPHTAKEYLDRAREKYALVGRQARTRTELYAEASRDGLLSPPMGT